ncbi:MAG: hypothetical protein QM813_03170 [Verrucomicrobiota bacterium]
MNSQSQEWSSRVLAMMQDIQGALTAEQGSRIEWAEIAEWTGESSATAHDRFQRNCQSQVEGFLRLVERLPDSTQEQLFSKHLKCYPCLNSRRLVHDRAQTAALLSLLEKRAGTTLIYGANAEDRTFVATALARKAGKFIEGVDAHRPSWFVGVSSIKYLDPHLALALLADTTQCKWSAPVLMLNGIFLRSSASIRSRIIEQAKNRHLLLVDGFAQLKISDWLAPVNTVRLVRDQNSLILAQIETH